MQLIEASREKYDAGLRRMSGVRYVTSDPIGLNEGINLYSYGNVTPILNIDPNGLTGYHPGFNPNGGGPMAPRGAIACANKAKAAAKILFLFPEDHLMHCFVTCQLVIQCGLDIFTAIGFGIGKEIMDMFDDKDDNVEWRDMLNNAAGIQCAISGEPNCKGCNNQEPEEAGACEACCRCKDRKGKLSRK